MMRKTKIQASKKPAARARKLAAAGDEIAAENAALSGDVGFSSPHLINCTLPHSKPTEIPFVRRTPWCKLALNGLPEFGLPYGSPARLFLAYVQTEVVRTGEQEILLAPTLYEAARRIGVGDDTRAIRRFKRQLLSCVSAQWIATIQDGRATEVQTYTLGSKVRFSYDPDHPQQVELWEPRFTVSADFYASLMGRRVPFDLRALRALARSPLGMDLYTWLAVKAPTLKERTFVPYTWLMQQWGVGYDRKSKSARSLFQRKVARELGNVLRVWPELRIEPTVRQRQGKPCGGIDIYPARPHVERVPSLVR